VVKAAEKVWNAAIFLGSILLLSGTGIKLHVAVMHDK